MIIFPAIDLFGKKAVRLLNGDYNNLTVYNDNPASVAKDFEKAGATHAHLVDLEGAKDGSTPNIEVIKQIVKATNLNIQVGGGIRNIETVKRYLCVGVNRVILGTAAVNDREFLKEVVNKFGEQIAVAADVKNGKIAIKGWVETADILLNDFLLEMQCIGVQNIICTDISKDGAMKGTNLKLYKELSEKYSLNITASGGVSSLEDIKSLKEMGLYGAIIGKGYYTGAIDLVKALEVAKC